MLFSIVLCSVVCFATPELFLIISISLVEETMQTFCVVSYYQGNYYLWLMSWLYGSFFSEIILFCHWLYWFQSPCLIPVVVILSVSLLNRDLRDQDEILSLAREHPVDGRAGAKWRSCWNSYPNSSSNALITKYWAFLFITLTVAHLQLRVSSVTSLVAQA